MYLLKCIHKIMNIIKTDNKLTKELALQLVSEEETEFKVSFDGLWQWCGYSTKGNAKKKLSKNFEEGFDFCIIQLDNTRYDGGYSRPEQKITLTLDAAKEFALLAQTSQGKEVRRYFIEAEKEYRQLLLTNKMYAANSVSKADLASMKQEIINEIRSNMAPVTTLSNKIEGFTKNILEKMNDLVKAQPTVNKIHTVIPAGYITYEDFKSKRNYAFKRGAWNYLTDRVNKDKIIPKTGFNRVEYFDEDTIMKTLIDLEAKRELKLSNGITGRAAKTTISII